MKIWVHVFLCMPIQVCIHVVHKANFVHVNYLCIHAYRVCTDRTQIVVMPPPCACMVMYLLYVNIFLLLYYLLILSYTKLKYVILVNTINNENLNHFSSLTTAYVSRLTICLETVKFQLRNNLCTYFFVYIKDLLRARYVDTSMYTIFQALQQYSCN